VRSDINIPGIRSVAAAAATAATVSVAVLLGTSTGWAKDITIRMAVPDHSPTRIMQDLANERYHAPSGNNVRLEIDFIPWPNYYERLAASLASGEKKYQMVISDSQWLGAFVEGGYYMRINGFIDADPELQAIFNDVHPSLIAAYSSYPYGSENYYGFPENPELLIVFYRRDLFCNTDEQATFEAGYGYELPCTPEEMNDVDWGMVRDFGEFFRRTEGEQLAGQTLDDDFYGIAYQAAKSYDGAIMQINAFIWQHGGSIWDEAKAPKSQAEGVVNSDTAVKALEHYLSLLQYMPPVVKTGTMDVMKVHELFREGKVAWIIAYNTLAETVIDPVTSKVADKVGFAMHPGLRQADGRIVRWANIAGQPFVFTTWNDDGTVREMIDFVKWWLSPEIQIEFAKRGGQSGRRSIYSMPEYNTFRPWNLTFGPSLAWQRDLWHVPTFFELLVQAQEEYDKAITGQQSARETMDNIAAFQQQHLSEEGWIE
jgi:multiple sugar transport system substrate-binding protein